MVSTEQACRCLLLPFLGCIAQLIYQIKISQSSLEPSQIGSTAFVEHKLCGKAISLEAYDEVERKDIRRGTSCVLVGLVWHGPLCLDRWTSRRLTIRFAHTTDHTLAQSRKTFPIHLIHLSLNASCSSTRVLAEW